jgi:hypothetical protein
MGWRHAPPLVLVCLSMAGLLLELVQGAERTRSECDALGVTCFFSAACQQCLPFEARASIDAVASDINLDPVGNCFFMDVLDRRIAEGCTGVGASLALDFTTCYNEFFACEEPGTTVCTSEVVDCVLDPDCLSCPDFFDFVLNNPGEPVYYNSCDVLSELSGRFEGTECADGGAAYEAVVSCYVEAAATAAETDCPLNDDNDAAQRVASLSTLWLPAVMSALALLGR